FSATSGSIELEWLFLSVTPMVGRKSSTDLLLTSNSLARSLMRTFSINPVSNAYLIPYDRCGGRDFTPAFLLALPYLPAGPRALLQWRAIWPTPREGAFPPPPFPPPSPACPVSAASVYSDAASAGCSAGAAATSRSASPSAAGAASSDPK